MALTQVTTHGIKDATVATADISNDSITSAKIISNSITSSELANGAVTNTEVASDAAIAGSKISPDFGSQDITTTGHLDLPDNSELKLGTGDDLKIFHDGSYSRINSPSHGLILRTDMLHVNNGANTTSLLRATSSAGVELYYTNSKKFETTSIGVNVTGRLQVDGDAYFLGSTSGRNIIFDKSDHALEFADNAYAMFGDDSDLQIYHSGSNSSIDHKGTGSLFIHVNNNFTVKDYYSNDLRLTAIKDGAVNLYYDNSNKLQTVSDGIRVTGHLYANDNYRIRLGNGNDLQIYHDGTNNIINTTTGSLLHQYNGTTVALQTDTRLGFQDNKKASFGTGNDLEIYHNGSHSFIDNSTGELLIRNTSSNSNTVQIRGKGDEDGLRVIGNGAVNLYYDNSKKLETNSGGVNVIGSFTVNGSAISSGGLGNVVEDTTPQLGGALGSNGNNILMADNDRIKFGTGQDLEIYHDGSHSYITNGSASGDIRLRAAEFVVQKPDGSEPMLKCIQNGAVELYHNNNKKFETYSSGVIITGNCNTSGNDDHPDNSKARFGTSNDFQIYHDGSNNQLLATNGPIHVYNGAPFELRKGYDASYETMLKVIPNGAVEAYYDNSKKFDTLSDGARVTGRLVVTGNYEADDNKKITLGNSQDLQLFHNTYNYITYANNHLMVTGDGSNHIYLRPVSNEYSAQFFCHGAAKLFYDNSNKLETTSSGVLTTGVLRVADGTHNSGNRIAVGTSQDILIYHIAGNDSYIRNNTGDMYFQGNRSGTIVNNIKFENSTGATELYYNNSKMFQTTSYGTELLNRAQFTQSANAFAMKLDATNSGYSTNIIKIHATRGGANNWAFIAADTNHGGSADREFTLRGDGHAFADASWNANGADYAEFFESTDGSAIAVGTTVVLENNKVRAATSSDAVADIIGVVRPKEPAQASTTIGNAAWNKWQNKYLTDDFDRYILDEHNVIEWTDADGKEHSYESHAIPSDVNVPSKPTIRTQDEDGNKFTHYRLNPNYNSERTYVPRHDRDEWVIVGLVGQVKVLKGQAANDRWIKMRDVSDTVQEYFIR